MDSETSAYRYPLPKRISRETRPDPAVLVSGSEALTPNQNPTGPPIQPYIPNTPNTDLLCKRGEGAAQLQHEGAPWRERHPPREAKQKLYSVGNQSLS